MTIETFENARRTNFTTVDNKFINDPEVTLQSKGLMMVLLSNTDDWKIVMPNIIKRSKTGRDAHYKCILELIKLGYYARITAKEDGVFRAIVHIFSDAKEDVEIRLAKRLHDLESSGYDCFVEYKSVKPKRKSPKKEPFTENQDTAEKPFTENPYPEKPNPENQYNNNTKTKNTNLENTKISSSSSRDNIDSELRSQFPDKPFDDIKVALINDESAVINTDNQYKKLLSYRLKNYKPKRDSQPQTTKRQAKTTRKEPDPDELFSTYKSQPTNVTREEIDDLLEQLK